MVDPLQSPFSVLTVIDPAKQLGAVRQSARQNPGRPRVIFPVVGAVRLYEIVQGVLK